MIYELDGRRPSIDPSCFVAPSASLIGSVTLGSEASVWFNVVIRADRERIAVGAGSNIQDGSVLHADPGYPLLIGAVIGRNCLIAANALVTEKMQVPDGAVVMGSPGRVQGILDEHRRAMIARNAVHYIANGRLFRERLQVPGDD